MKVDTFYQGHFQKGLSEKGLGLYQDAKESFELALELDSKNERVKKLVAEMREKCPPQIFSNYQTKNGNVKNVSTYTIPEVIFSNFQKAKIIVFFWQF